MGFLSSAVSIQQSLYNSHEGCELSGNADKKYKCEKYILIDIILTLRNTYDEC